MERSPFPEIKLVDPTRAIELGKSALHFLNPFKEVPDHMSDHYRGAAEMLDHYLEQPCRDGE